MAIGTGHRVEDIAHEVFGVVTQICLSTLRGRRRHGDLKEVEYLALSILQGQGTMIVGDIQRNGLKHPIEVVENGTGGANMSMFNLFRSTFANGAMLAEQRVSPTAAQQFMFRIVHSQITCTGDESTPSSAARETLSRASGCAPAGAP